MALADIIIPRRTIEVGSASFNLRPLCVDDVMRALFDAQQEVADAMALYNKTVADPNDDAAMSAFMAALLRDAPALVSRAIAYAADEPESHEIVRRLPLPIQTEAFYAIVDMTFSEPDSLKKFAEKLTLLVGRMTPKSST
jgi:hypothetical protein